MAILSCQINRVAASRQQFDMKDIVPDIRIHDTFLIVIFHINAINCHVISPDRHGIVKNARIIDLITQIDAGMFLTEITETPNHQYHIIADTAEFADRIPKLGKPDSGF